MSLIVILKPQEYQSGYNYFKPAVISHTVSLDTGKIDTTLKGTPLKSTDAVYDYNRRQYMMHSK